MIRQGKREKGKGKREKGKGKRKKQKEKRKKKNTQRFQRSPLRSLRGISVWNLGGTMPKKKITPLWQGNKYWADAVVGILPYNVTAKYKKENTIAKIGCLVTCYCMLLQYLTGIEWYPDQLNYLLKRHGGFDKNLVVHSSISYLFNEFIFGGLYLCKDVPAPVSDITLMLPTIIKIDYDPHTTQIEGHWVLAMEKGKDRDDYLIADPLSGQIEWLLGKYGKKGWNLERIILAAVNRKNITTN